MSLVWSGIKDLQSSVRAFGANVTRDVGGINGQAAVMLRDRALLNMDRSGLLSIAVITRLSRDLLVASTGARGSLLGTAIGALAGTSRFADLSATAGYLAWPADVEPYPIYLNYGTRSMRARPYFSDAFRVTVAWWESQLPSVLRRAAVVSRFG